MSKVTKFLIIVIVVGAIIGGAILFIQIGSKTTNNKNETAQSNEEKTDASGKENLDSEETGPWTENKDNEGNITITKENQTLHIGDYVNYTTEKSPDTKWRVLGVENGNLLLMADENVKENNTELSVHLSGEDWGEDGQTLVEQLNESCQPYLNTSYAKSVRSIKVEDINNITGY